MPWFYKQKFAHFWDTACSAVVPRVKRQEDLHGCKSRNWVRDWENSEFCWIILDCLNCCVHCAVTVICCGRVCLFVSSSSSSRAASRAVPRCPMTSEAEHRRAAILIQASTRLQRKPVDTNSSSYVHATEAKDSRPFRPFQVRTWKAEKTKEGIVLRLTSARLLSRYGTEPAWANAIIQCELLSNNASNSVYTHLSVSERRPCDAREFINATRRYQKQ